MVVDVDFITVTTLFSVVSTMNTPSPLFPAPLILLFALIISLVIFVPLTGVLVRFRANYNPKGLQLDSEGGAVPYTGPVVHSYFGMMARVYRLEVRM